jgi:hypothetical protein
VLLHLAQPLHSVMRRMPLRTLLLIFSVAPMVGAAPSLAQEAVLSVRGCGTGCRIETRQLSEPRLMGDGWAKVLERTSLYIVDMKGREEKFFRGQPLPAIEQYWIFAKCNDKWFGTGFKSDGSDAKTESIYDENGNPKSYTAAGNVYDRHQKLCGALKP